MAEQVCLKGQSLWKTHAGSEEKTKKEQQTEITMVLTANTTTPPPLPFLASPKALSITCSDSK